MNELCQYLMSGLDLILFDATKFIEYYNDTYNIYIFENSDTKNIYLSKHSKLEFKYLDKYHIEFNNEIIVYNPFCTKLDLMNIITLDFNDMLLEPEFSNSSKNDIFMTYHKNCIELYFYNLVIIIYEIYDSYKISINNYELSYHEECHTLNECMILLSKYISELISYNRYLKLIKLLS